MPAASRKTRKPRGTTRLMLAQAITEAALRLERIEASGATGHGTIGRTEAIRSLDTAVSVYSARARVAAAA